MKAVASFVFQTMMFPHNARIITIDQVSHYEPSKLKEHEKNYETHDLELAFIVHAIKKWRHFLMGKRFELMTDHNGLKYLFVLVVEPDYLPHSEVLAFSCVYTPWSIYTPEVCTLFHAGECRGVYPLCRVQGGYPPGWGVWGQAGPQRGFGGKPPKQKLPCKSIL